MRPGGRLGPRVVVRRRGCPGQPGGRLLGVGHPRAREQGLPACPRRGRPGCRHGDAAPGLRDLLDARRRVRAGPAPHPGRRLRRRTGPGKRGHRAADLRRGRRRRGRLLRGHGGPLQPQDGPLVGRLDLPCAPCGDRRRRVGVGVVPRRRSHRLWDRCQRHRLHLTRSRCTERLRPRQRGGGAARGTAGVARRHRRHPDGRPGRVVERRGRLRRVVLRGPAAAPGHAMPVVVDPLGLRTPPHSIAGMARPATMERRP